MFEPLGYSVYLTSFDRQKEMLQSSCGTGAAVFLSLHMSEEFGPDYCQKADKVCGWLSEAGFRIIADVSVKTIIQFGESDLLRLATRLHVWALRIDYGLNEEQIKTLASAMPIVLNASVTDKALAKRITATGSLVMAMHNFYPRPETGLDEGFLRTTTRALQAAGIKTFAFIPGDQAFRGPICQGLPTLEKHRGQPPSACFADLVLRFGVDGVFVGDPGISALEQKRIQFFCQQEVLIIPAELNEEYQELYGRVFTCRQDSPLGLIRFAESREYSCCGVRVQPQHCAARTRGSITIDNDYYGRYSGELQLIRCGLPADGRVNVIGSVKQEYLLLGDCIRNGGRFALVPG